MFEVEAAGAALARGRRWGCEEVRKMELSGPVAGAGLDHDERENGREPLDSVQPAIAGQAKESPSGADDLSLASDGGCCVLKSSSFGGRLRFEGAARIECQVGGEIHGTGTITVAESGVVMAPISAASVLVAGRVRADITASERIEVAPSGRISGRLTAPVMVVHENAQVEGRITMTRSRPA
jgi:cytoskeletal protein CcmA (bactofilin family)